jgi:hypothetical protein
LAAILGKLTPAQKAALGKSTPSPFKFAIPTPDTGAAGDGLIVRMLLNSGIPASGVGSEEMANAVISEDAQGIVIDLLDHGATIRESESSENKGSETLPSPLLQVALQHGKSELMARLITAGANPNYRGNTGTNAIEWAIADGDHASLDLLLTHGGHIDTVVEQSHADNTTSLDLAVLSGDAKMVKRISNLWKVDLSHACIPVAGMLSELVPGAIDIHLESLIFNSDDNRDLLLELVLGATDSYWEYLINNGFGKGGELRGCSKYSMLVRLVNSIFRAPDTILVGWAGKRFESRLNTLLRIELGAGKLEPAQAETWLQNAHATRRADIASLLQRIGVKGDAPKDSSLPSIGKPTSADTAQQKKLAGHYYLKDVNEVGSEILLRPDGRFEYMLAYGAYDELSRGTWVVRNGRLVLRTPKPKDVTKLVPYKLILRSNTPIEHSKDVSVHVVYKNAAVKDVSVTVFGCDVPEVSVGRIEDEGWTGELSGLICQIVLQHPKINGGRGFVYVVPENTEKRNFTFEYQPPKEQAVTELNVEMTLENGELVWARSERLFHYARN